MGRCGAPGARLWRPYMGNMTLKQFYLLKVENGLMETLENIQLVSTSKKEQKNGNLGLQLFEIFVAMDVDGSGEIALEEFYEHFGLIQSKFVERVFAEFDLDGSENLSFEEFVVGVWNFCTLNLARFCKYAIDIFDLDRQQTINQYQCDALARMIHGLQETPDDLAAAIRAGFQSQDAAEDPGPRNMDLRAFTEFATLTPDLLGPVLQVQRVLRSRIFSAKFWDERTQLRTETFGELEPTESILLRKRQDPLQKLPTFRLGSSASSRISPEAVTSSSPAESALVGGDLNKPIGTSSAGSGLLSQSTTLSKSTPDEASAQTNAPTHILSGARSAGGVKRVDALAAALFDEDRSESEENIYVFDVDRSPAHDAASDCFQRVNKCKRAYLAALEAHQHNSIEIFSSQDEEQLVENEALARVAAEAKHSFQLAVNDLEVLGRRSIDEAEKQLYAQALAVVEEEARFFFRTKEGREHLRIVGAEHALRDEQAATRFGALTKKARQAGEQKARNEYIARKARAQNEVIAEIVRDRIETHATRIANLYKDHKLYTKDQEDLVIQWQWQKILDQESKQFYFHCPALQVTLWAEPYLLNGEGWCEDPSCDNDALIRCSSCNAEYCADCDMILHSCGPQRNHKRRAQIPPEEVIWRARVRKLPDDVRRIATREPCHDVVELTRRHIIDQARRDEELYGPAQPENSDSGASKGLLASSLLQEEHGDESPGSDYNY